MEAQRSGCEAGPLPQRCSQSLQEEAWFSHSRLLHTACVRTGSRDPDDLWDHLYEVDYRRQDTAEFIRSVLVYCALARRDASDKQLAADGCLAREQAMAAAIARQRGRRWSSRAVSTRWPCRKLSPPCPRRWTFPPKIINSC